MKIIETIFGKKNRECFFCKAPMNVMTEYTLQFSSREGIHTQKVCKDCAEILDGIAENVEETKNG